MDYFLGDTHFNHLKIIELCNRPFKNIDEMNETIIDNWNSIVDKDDTVYHFGDLAFAFDRDSITNILSKLNGKKILILGNHDVGRTKTFWKSVGISEVHHLIVYKNKYVFTHVPIDPEKYGYKGMINVHAHTHDLVLDNYSSDNHICVSVEKTDYKPVSLDFIRRK